MSESLHLPVFDDDRCEDHPDSRFGWIPVWGISLLFHVIVLLVLAFFMWEKVSGGVGETEREFDVQIAFKSQDGDRTVYEAAEDEPQDAGAEDDTPAADASLRDITEITATDFSKILDSTQRPEIPDLKSQLAGILPQDGDSVNLAPAGAALTGELGKVSGGTFGGLGGGTGTTFFGAVGEGQSFTYVFDRSGSMEGGPLRVAKTELTQSLRKLKSNQQFQLVFYHHDVLVFSPGRLNFATDRNIRDAASFISHVTADGGTNHKAALLAALKLRTDVIFFMTDADEPPMTAGDLAEIHRAAAGTQIHAIHFGSGPLSDKVNFLMKLAQQNRGDYHYVDTNQLRAY